MEEKQKRKKKLKLYRRDIDTLTGGRGGEGQRGGGERGDKRRGGGDRGG